MPNKEAEMMMKINGLLSRYVTFFVYMKSKGTYYINSDGNDAPFDIHQYFYLYEEDYDV